MGSKLEKDEHQIEKTISFTVKVKCERCGKTSKYKLKYTGKIGERYKGIQLNRCQNKRCDIVLDTPIDITIK